MFYAALFNHEEMKLRNLLLATHQIFYFFILSNNLLKGPLLHVVFEADPFQILLEKRTICTSDSFSPWFWPTFSLYCLVCMNYMQQRGYSHAGMLEKETTFLFVRSFVVEHIQAYSSERASTGDLI